MISLHLRNREWDAAKLRLLEALELQEKISGKLHGDVGQICNNLGLLYGVQDQQKEAQAYFERALNIFRAKYGLGHIYTMTCERNIEDLKANR